MSSLASPRCRSCGSILTRTVLDLGSTPLANAYLTEAQLREGNERSYLLHARVCERCWLVQIDQVIPPETMFSDYAYFSAVSDTWLDHAQRYARMAIDRLGLNAQSFVVEVGSNDGYLLRAFMDFDIDVCGIEPAANVAEVAIAAGVPTEVCFFGLDCARELVDQGRAADLVVANNVLAHVPDLDDFVRGLAALLRPDGVLTIEVPHLLQIIERVEFDTIYHEHCSYFSLLSACTALETRGLRVFDVEELATHGGSLRIWAAQSGTCSWPTTERVEALLGVEHAAGLDQPGLYEGFTVRVERARTLLRAFLDDVKREGKTIAAYGAAAKGNTLLNSVGATADDVAYVVDRSPHKQGRFLPGSHIPIHGPDHVRQHQPDYLLLLAWNLRDEIIEQMSDVRRSGCRFVIPIPEVEVLE